MDLPSERYQKDDNSQTMEHTSKQRKTGGGLFASLPPPKASSSSSSKIDLSESSRSTKTTSLVPESVKAKLKKPGTASSHASAALQKDNDSLESDSFFSLPTTDTRPIRPTTSRPSSSIQIKPTLPQLSQSAQEEEYSASAAYAYPALPPAASSFTHAYDIVPPQLTIPNQQDLYSEVDIQEVFYSIQSKSTARSLKDFEN